METSLAEYLYKRGLSLDPQTVDEDLVLTEELLTKEVSDIWVGHKNAITAVVQSRINAIAKYLLHTAIPQEVTVLRQSIVELGAIITDFETYHAEVLRRDSKKVDNNKIESSNPEPPKEGEESSL